MTKAMLIGPQQGRRLMFWCPGCDNPMNVRPEQWNWNGSVDRPTLSPSILQKCGPFPDGHTDICHCYVRDGNIEFLNDCTHDKRGVMPLPELEDVINIHVEADGSVTWSRK